MRHCYVPSLDFLYIIYFNFYYIPPHLKVVLQERATWSFSSILAERQRTKMTIRLYSICFCQKHSDRSCFRREHYIDKHRSCIMATYKLGSLWVPQGKSAATAQKYTLQLSWYALCYIFNCRAMFLKENHCARAMKLFERGMFLFPKARASIPCVQRQTSCSAIMPLVKLKEEHIARRCSTTRRN